jgi:two-component system NtrC family sensor kinase
MPPAVLYVDDEEDNVSVFEALHERLFPIRTASSGEEALALLRRQDTEIGVVLTDQRMPGMSGIDLAEMVHREFPDVVTILITAFADLIHVIDAINRGEVHRYLRKPWVDDDLELALREALSVYDMRRRIAELERSLYDTGRVYALGVVAASVANEFATPLSALKLNLDLLSSQLSRIPWTHGAGPTAAEMRGVLSDAIESTRYLEDLVNGISTTTRPSVEEESVDLAEVVGTVLRMLKPTINKRARMSFESLPAPAVRAARSKVGQIVMNLVVNAVQSLPDRAVHENMVRVQVRGAGDCVQLTVEDNGPGIPPELLDRIWDPFFTTRRDVGTGLGLAITKRIVGEYGGHIFVETGHGPGTRFRVTLPAAS